MYENLYVYIYIYIVTYVCIYIYIYLYTEGRACERQPGRASGDMWRTYGSHPLSMLENSESEPHVGLIKLQLRKDIELAAVPRGV